MLPFRTILCPTDFSVPSEAAVTAAVELARHFHATLRLIHVVPALPTQAPDLNYTFRVPEYEAALRADAEEKLKQLAARLCGEGLTPEFSVGQGDPGHEIARMAHEFGADLVVIGTHGETGWRHALFGSVAERVVRLTTCPVLAARPAKTS